jgi:hypothetical protein
VNSLTPGDSDYGGFAWTIDGGFVDLKDLVAGDLASTEWAKIVAGLRVTANNDIVGLGQLTDGTAFAPFVMTNTPEPAASLLTLMPLVMTALRRRK